MSSSSRAKRMDRRHKRHRPAGMSLVSLMDIFTILVFFLLVNSAEVQTLEPPEMVELPESMSQARPRETVVVMVTPEEVLVQGRRVATIAEIEAMEGTIIEPLREALREQTDRVLRQSQRLDVAAREVTILGDKAVPYRVLKKVMATSTDADYGKLSLAVLQREEAMAAMAAVAPN